MSDSDYSAFGKLDLRRAACPECEKETRVDTLFEKYQRWDAPDIQGKEEYYVFQCRGCETIFFAKASSNSEDYFLYYDHTTGKEEIEYNEVKTLWPSVPKTPTPSWAGFNLSSSDQVLFDLLHSIYKAMNNEMPILAAIGMRTAFDRVSLFLDVESHFSFAEKLEAMRKGGHISGVQKGILEVLINAGNAAAHAGWSPKPQQLKTMLEILEALIRDQFILKAEVAELAKKVPKKPFPS